jgi:hypothetical protein
MANQVQLPLIQSQNGDLTQTQTNTNKVLRNLDNKIVDLQTLVNQTELIGEIKIVSNTLQQMQAIAGKGWILANGQSCIGTDYQKLTGNTTVPNGAIVFGVNSYIKVNNG